MPIQYVDRATILTATEPTGEFTTVAITGLVCRFVHVAAGGASAGERSALLRLRRLYWLPDVALPSEHVAVVNEATGDRYQTVPGTQAAFRLLGRLHHRSIDLVEAEAA